MFLALLTVLSVLGGLVAPVAEATGGAQATPSGTHDVSLSSAWTVFDAGVNVVAGNLSFAETDLAIPSIGFPTTIARTYNSAAAETDGPLGHGWSWSLGTHVTVVAGGAEVLGADGRNDPFVRGESGAYTPPAGVYDRLTDIPAGGWLLVRHDQGRLTFNSAGVLASAADPNGNALYLTYAAGRLASARDTAERTWSFDLTLAGRIAAVHDPAGRTTSYGYDAAGNLTSVVYASGASATFAYSDHRLTTMTDPNGHAVNYIYDGLGRVVVATDPVGSATTFGYDEANRHTTVTDARTNIRSYDYDAGNRVSRFTDALGHAESWTWDASNNRTSVTDRNGGVTTLGYDGRGNVISVTDAEGGRSTDAFDAQNHPTVGTDALGRVTTRTYDARGNPATVTDAAGRVTTFAHDARGQLVASNDGNGNTTSVGYDGAGNPTSTTDALGHVNAQEYDSAGRVTREIDADGRATSHTYDSLGRLLSTTDGAGGVSTSAFDAGGNRTTTTDARGNVTRFFYNAADQLTRAVDALGGSTDISLDGNGNQTSIADPLGRRTTFAYDPANRVVATTDANGHTSTVDYDPVGNQIGTTDAKGRTTSFRYDHLNRLVGVDDAEGGHANYVYDVVGNRTSTTDPNGNTTRTTFNALNQAVSETDPLAHASTVRYDGIGNVIGRTDPNGVVTHLRHDAANRLIRADYAEGAVTFAYDNAGNRIGVTDQGGTTTYTYDGLERLTSTTTGTEITRYEYDPNSNLTRLANPDGTYVAHTYDALNREVAMTDAAGQTSTFTYDAAGRRSSEDRPNDTRATYSYDPGGRITSINWTGPGGTAVAGFAYTYDEVGNKTQVVDGSGASTFAYDDLDRLTSATYPNDGTVTYSYDPAGNRTAMTVDGVTTAYSYNAANQQTSAGGNAVTWDASGNMLTNGSTTYRHDSQNRLIGVERGSLVEQFSYNGADQRTSQGVNGVVTRYGYDLHRDLAHVVTESSPDNAHVYGLSNQPLWDTSTDLGRTYYHQDAMGSTVALTRADGSVLGTRTYDAFGAPRGPQIGTGSYWFNGEQYDPNSGLIYLRARYYDPATGRFLEPDPAGPDLTSPQTLNKYAYANNNPLRYIDPSGQYISIVLLLAVNLVIAGALVKANAPEVTAAVGKSITTGRFVPPHNLNLFPWQDMALIGMCAYGVCEPAAVSVAKDVLEYSKAFSDVAGQVVDGTPPRYMNYCPASAEVRACVVGSGSGDVASGTRSTGGGGQNSGRQTGSSTGKAAGPPPEPLFGGIATSFLFGGRVVTPRGGAYIPLGYVPAAGVSGGTAAGGVAFCKGTQDCPVLGIGGYSDLAPWHLDRNIVSLVNNGFHVTLWDQPNLSGTPTYFDTSAELPQNKKNTTRSLRVERLGDTRCGPGTDGVILFRDTNYATAGGCISTQTSIADLRPSTFDEAISSLKFVGSFVGTKQVLFYRQANYQGLCGTFTQNWSDLQACARVALSVEVREYTPPPPIPVPPGTFYAGNAAPYATRDGAGSDVTVDGSLDGEWLQGSATGLGFSWPNPVTTGHIVVWDRLPTPAANGIGVLSIGFSDGTILNELDMVVAGARCVDVTFPARTITWLNVIPIETYAPGYREVQVWATTGQQSSQDACPNRRTAVPVEGVFPPPTVIAAPAEGPPGPPISDLVVSSVASESSDGIAHDAGHPFILPAVVHYETLTIKPGAYASVGAWNGSSGGSTGVTVDGHVQIDGVLDVSRRGYRGGAPVVGAGGGVQGEGHLGVGTRSIAPNGGGGGGAEGADSGGGGAGYGSDGAPGIGPSDHPLTPGGVQYGDSNASTVHMGSGGGSSGAQSTSFGAAGGAGGGAVEMKAASITVTGRVSVNGQDGTSVEQGSAANWRGGGGGSGGTIRLVAATIDAGAGLVTATGGAGGYGVRDATWPADGGVGGVGRIRLEYTLSHSGTTNPAASAARVTTTTSPDLVVSSDPAQSSDGQAHGPDNPYLIAAGSTFGDVTVLAGAHATGTAWNGNSGGTLSFVAIGDVGIEGTLTVNGNGYRGGPAVGGASEGMQGESLTGLGVKSADSNTGGGGGGSHADSGGGGGGHGSPGTGGQGPSDHPTSQGGVVYGEPSLSTARLGSGGGSSGAQSSATGAPGGNGGGTIDIQAATIVVTGQVSANGEDGPSVRQGGDNNWRGGGGGSGGSIRLHATKIDISSSVTALGGAGGFGTHDGTIPASGGHGGDGRIRIEFSQSAAGTSTPSASQVSYGGPLDRLDITPQNATSVAGATGQTYSVTGFDADGTSLGGYTAASSFAIAPDGSCSGATCTATTSGPHTVTATTAGTEVTANLLVMASVLDRLVVSPTTATITAGDTSTYVVHGTDQYDNDIGDLTAEATFELEPDGSCIGPNCTAVRPGPHTVTITIGDTSTTANLTVVAGPLDRLNISPSNATIDGGDEQPFSTHGYDQYNNDLGQATASTEFAISPDGACVGASCSATTSGAHTVTATNGLSVANAAVFIEALTAQSISFTTSSTGVVGDSAGQSASGGASGNPVVFSVHASSDPGVCTVTGTNGSTVTYAIAGTCVLAANQAGGTSHTAAPQVLRSIAVSNTTSTTTTSSPSTTTTTTPTTTASTTVVPAGGGGGGGGGTTTTTTTTAVPSSRTVGPGGTVSSDPIGTTPTAGNPVVAAVALPNGGTASVVKSGSSDVPTGYIALGSHFDVTAPSATVDHPLALTFDLDAGSLPAGSNDAHVTVFRNGQPIADCTGAAGVASPDPCVSGRDRVGSVLSLRILSSHASKWDLGVSKVARLAGTDRLRTATAVSKATYPIGGQLAVVLARGDAFADALAGGPLAVKVHGPLLLSTGATLPAVVEAEISRVAAANATIYVLGGTGAISSAISDRLQSLGFTVVRLAGTDRSATSVAVAEALGMPARLFMARGDDFADSLAAGPTAASVGGAILLTDGDHLSPVVAQYIAAHPATPRTAVGGLAARADPGATPIVGADRYDTAAKLASAFFPNATGAGVASGVSFADGLVATAMLGLFNQPLLLTPSGELAPATSAWLGGRNEALTTVNVFGGAAAVSDRVSQAIATTLA